MRRLAAVLLATTMLLAGCSGDADGGDGDTDGAVETNGDAAVLEAVTVEGDLGSAPTLTFEQPFAIAAPVARVDTAGTGAELAAGQSVSFHYIAINGDDGTSLASTWDEGATQTIVLDEQTIPELTDVLVGQAVGVRVLFATPGGPAVPATDTTAATEAYPAVVMALEVLDARTVPTRAEGAAVEPAAGLPTVTLAENGEPTITVPADAVEPTELVVQPLIKGAGTEVAAGDTITVHYTGALWDGTVFDSSWAGAPFPTPIGAGQLIAGWDTGLVGQTVGSQVLLVIPGDLGYGEAGSGAIPPDATLVFVVDILDAS